MPFPCLLGGTCLLRKKHGSTAPKKLGPLRLPIVHSTGVPNEGEYLVRIAIGGEYNDFVVDSASECVIVIGNTCGAQCMQNSGVYDQLSITATGETSTLDYGTQTSYISWAMDTFNFPTALNPTVDQQLQKMGRKLKVGVITKNVPKPFAGLTMPGTSILGLMAPQRADQGKGLGILNEEDNTTFINQVFGKNGIFERSVYSIHVDSSLLRGELILGGLHDGIKGWVPLVPASELPILLYEPQWVLRLNRVAVIGLDGSSLRELPLKYARFDTGCTYWTMPGPILQQNSNLVGIPGIAGLRFELDNGVVWWVPLELFSSSKTVQLDTGFGGVVPNDSAPDDWCVLANELMKDMTVACDLENACLGFGGPLISVHPSA